MIIEDSCKYEEFVAGVEDDHDIVEPYEDDEQYCQLRPGSTHCDARDHTSTTPVTQD